MIFNLIDPSSQRLKTCFANARRKYIFYFPIYFLEFYLQYKGLYLRYWFYTMAPSSPGLPRQPTSRGIAFIMAFQIAVNRFQTQNLEIYGNLLLQHMNTTAPATPFSTQEAETNSIENKSEQEHNLSDKVHVRSTTSNIPMDYHTQYNKETQSLPSRQSIHRLQLLKQSPTTNKKFQCFQTILQTSITPIIDQ